MDNQKLSEKIDYTKELFGESILPEIREAILNNLKHNMWPLQEEAFRNFLFYENVKEGLNNEKVTGESDLSLALMEIYLKFFF